MKKLISVMLILALAASLFCLPAAAAAESPSRDAAHLYYSGAKESPYACYGSDAYLYDTLTLAGSGLDGISIYTVFDLETLALDPKLELGYENEYSLMTSGAEYSHHVLSGLSLYGLLLHSGLDKGLPASTPVRCISKDGYSISFTLGQISDSSRYARYASTEKETPLESGLPVLVAFGSDGLPLVGPTGDEPVYKNFTEAEGFSPKADNVGGPLRLIMGQTSSIEFNAPNCSKWLAAVVVGDPGDYVYERDFENTDDGSEPEAGGDWSHGSAYADYTLTISGSEADGAVLTLSQLEAMSDCIQREYFAASAGKNAYEGLALRQLIAPYLAEGISRPTSITVKSSDGYAVELNVTDVFEGITSRYQPGKHKDILLAYAIDGAALVADENAEGYNGYNAFGPLRLVVENTISAWVKSVSEIILGEPEEDGPKAPPYSDIDHLPEAVEAIRYLTKEGVILGLGDGTFGPDRNITRGDLVLMLSRAFGFQTGGTAPFQDVPRDSYYHDAIAGAAALGIAKGDGSHFYPGEPVTVQDALVLICRALVSSGLELKEESLDGFAHAGALSDYAKGPTGALMAAGFLSPDTAALEPGGPITRAGMACSLYLVLTKI